MNVSSVIAAFSEEQAERLTGVSTRQLRYWDSIDFYNPTYADPNRRVAFSRVYSFKDIVALRVLNILRNQYSVPLQHLRDVSGHLSGSQENRWTGIKLWVLNRRVVWEEPGTKLPQEIVSNQYVVPMILETVANDTRNNVATFNVRPDADRGQVVRSRFISHNAYVIKGTRIPVDAIKRFAAAGYTTDQIMREYPDLNDKDIEAAIAHEATRAAA